MEEGKKVSIGWRAVHDNQEGDGQDLPKKMVSYFVFRLKTAI